MATIYKISVYYLTKHFGSS